MKNLGWANGWRETPPEVIEAEKKGYKVTSVSCGHCVTEYVCEEGGWFYKVDSSD